MREMVSIIIVNYNVADLLLKCIISVYKYTTVNPFELIVIDNNSSDNSRLLITSNFPDVIWIQNTHNAGFPKANNQGMRMAKGNYFFLLNPDTELIQDSILRLQSFLESNKHISLVAPMLLNSDKTIQRSLFRFPKIRYILFENFYLNFLTSSKYYEDKDLHTGFEIDSASGAALFFRRQLIEKIGMLNEKLFWIEDVDFCYRNVLNGGKNYYLPDTKIIHHSGQSAKKNYNVSISNQVTNKIRFYYLYNSFLALSIVYVITILNVTLRLILFGLLAPFKKLYFLKMRAYLFTIPKLFTATADLTK